MDIREVREGEISPDGQGVLNFGVVSKVVTSSNSALCYSESMEQMFWMKMAVLYPIIMGCYGIGVSRLLSAVMEQHARLFVNKTPKVDTVTLGESTSLKNWHHLMHLITVNVGMKKR